MYDNDYYVYILANYTNVAIYVGVTNDLARRVYEHKSGEFEEAVTARHNIHKLVYFEHTNDVNSAIEREKQIKGWNRARKNRLIENKNPQWRDLYDDILE